MTVRPGPSLEEVRGGNTGEETCDQEHTRIHRPDQFGQILARVSANRERFLVTKNGEAKAIILGVEDFLQAVVKTLNSLAALQEQAKKAGTDQLTLEEIEAEIAAVRREKSKRRTKA